MVTLQDIDANNWEACVELDVLPEQEDFVASNVYSLAQWRFLPHFVAKGIYHDNTMVGFVFYGVDAEDGNYWLYRLMVDAKYQKQGYGRMALRLVISDIRWRNQAQNIPYFYLSYEPENHVAKALYQSEGFEIEGMAEWGEEMAKLAL